MQQQNSKQIFAEIVRARRSVRGFLPTPVKLELMKEVFELAQTAPSNCNTQPWSVHVVSGDIRHRLQQGLTTALRQGEFAMDFPYMGKYTGIFKTRQYDAAKQLYNAMGIEREDKNGRDAAFQRNYCFFDAPHAAFLFLPEEFGIREAADLGMYAQNLMLALTAAGIASCPQTALSFNADLVRQLLGVPNNMKLLFGLSFGYEDKSVKANQARVGRASLEQIVTFHK